MGHRGTIQRVLKWSGASVCGLVLAIWIFSLLRCPGYWRMYWNATLERGVVHVEHVRFQAKPEFFAGWEQRRSRALGIHCSAPGARGWGFTLPSSRRCAVPSMCGNDPVQLTFLITAEIPLWLPLALTAVPTGLLWWSDRRRLPAGHCRACGYNLTGNITGRCPECGTTAPASPSSGKPAQ